MLLKRLLQVLFLLVSFNFLQGQNNFSPTHHSSGKVEQILISGFGNHICQLLGLIREINFNKHDDQKTPLTVFISFPNKVKEFKDTLCLYQIISANELKKSLLKEFTEIKGTDTLYSRESLKDFQLYQDKAFQNKVDQKFDQALKDVNTLKDVFEYYIKSSIDSSIQVYWTNKVKSLDYVQDCFVVLNDGYNIKLIAQNKPDIQSDIQSDIRVLGDNLAQLEYIQNDTVDFNFDGGNILLTESAAFVGKDIFILNPNDIDSLKNNIKEKFEVDTVLFLGQENLFPNEIHKNKPSYQPQYHLDLFMNILENKDSIIILFGKTDLNFIQDVDKSTAKIFNDRVDSLITKLPKKINGKMVVIDSIPFHLVCVGGVWLSYSFNNGLIEYLPGNPVGSKCYLPYYSQEKSSIDTPTINAYQEKIAHTYAKYGIKNISYIKSAGSGFNLAVHADASMHCLLNVLKRSNPYTNP